jgi:hypothetical protein
MLGSVDSHFLSLSGGVEHGFFQSQVATKLSTVTTEVRLLNGHKGTKHSHDHSCRAGLPILRYRTGLSKVSSIIELPIGRR